jgi:hypothetical protein
VAVGGFNGDGHLDLAVANGDSDTMSVLLNQGDGTFRAAQNYTVGFRPEFVAVGDFDGDGHLDLAAADNVTVDNPQGMVSVLLGQGDGTFQAAQTSVTGGNFPVALAVEDFNGDGKLDLAVANSDSDAVSILLGRSIVAGDFNGDGHIDLAVANSLSKTVGILLGNGDGTFHDAGAYEFGSNPTSVAVADFNGDGHLDLAVVNSALFSGESSSINILLGRGDGSFQDPQTYIAGFDLNGGKSLAVGDFNHDGLLDLAVAGVAGISIWLGKGDATFIAGQNYAAGDYPVSVAVGDFDGDGVPDLAAANGGVSLLFGKGDGNLRAAPIYDTGIVPSSVAVLGDFNRDGHLDLAVAGNNYASSNPGMVSVLLGNGDGSFQVAQTYAVGSDPVAVVAGDFNGDGHLDLVVATAASYPDYKGTLSILLGKGDGAFQAAQTHDLSTDPRSLAVGDFNGDGYLDLAMVGFNSDRGTVSILLGKGDGTFQASRSYAAGYVLGPIEVGDFNGDGFPDLAVAKLGDIGGAVGVFLGKGDGTFEAAQSYAVGYSPISICVADFNGDGHLDLAVANFGYSFDGLPGSVSALLGKGDGTFQPAQTYAIAAASVAVGDFNRDGIPDLALISGSSASVLLGMGDGTFQAPLSYTAGTRPGSLVVGDFNDLGFLDLAVIGDFGVTLLINAGDWGR